MFHRGGGSIKSYHRAWIAASRRAGCPGRIPHDSRRTAVRNLVRAGVPDAVAMRLIAASYEDTMRRMGAAFAGVETRVDLADVLAALKKAGTLHGASISTANGYLKFRNDALHADWDKLDRAVVGSCISFVEEMVLKHFS